MGNDPSLVYYVLVILTIFNVFSILVWFCITNLIRITAKAAVTIDPVSASAIKSISGTGNASQGVIKYTTQNTLPQVSDTNGRTVRVIVTLPYDITTYEVAVISNSVSQGTESFNATSYSYKVVEKGSNYFIFENTTAVDVDTTYTMTYLIVNA